MMNAREFKATRLALKLSQSGMAMLLGLGPGSQSTISKKETGEHPVSPIEEAFLNLVRRFANVRDYLKLKQLQEDYAPGRNGPRPRD